MGVKKKMQEESMLKTFKLRRDYAYKRLLLEQKINQMQESCQHEIFMGTTEDDKCKCLMCNKLVDKKVLINDQKSYIIDINNYIDYDINDNNDLLFDNLFVYIQAMATNDLLKGMPLKQIRENATTSAHQYINYLMNKGGRKI